MLIKIEDLKIGDEILVSSQRRLKYLRALRLPKLKKGSTDDYKADFCSLKINEQKSVFSGKTYIRKIPECTAEDHNTQKYENLNYKQIWLVKRQGE